MVIKYTEEQLNSVDKSMLIHMFLNQQEQLEKVSADLHSLDTVVVKLFCNTCG